jgi:hypothetical protein
MGVKKVWSTDNQCEMYRADYSVILNGGRKRIRKDYFTKVAAEKAIEACSAEEEQDHGDQEGLV